VQRLAQVLVIASNSTSIRAGWWISGPARFVTNAPFAP
jgi:hypothetical protein